MAFCRTRQTTVLVIRQMALIPINPPDYADSDGSAMGGVFKKPLIITHNCNTCCYLLTMASVHLEMHTSFLSGLCIFVSHTWILRPRRTGRAAPCTCSPFFTERM